MAKFNMGQLMMTFLLIIIGLALTPTVQQSVTAVTGSGGNNLTGAALALGALIPLFWVIIILAVGVAAVYVQFKGM